MKRGEKGCIKRGREGMYEEREGRDVCREGWRDV